MSAALAIGFRGLSAQTQERLIRDAWLLMAAWILIGLACSWLLLEQFHLRSPLVRYPLTAVVMYALGIVAGTRLWLAAFSRAVRRQPGRFGAAPDLPPGDPRFHRRTRVAGGLDPELVLGAIFLFIDVLLWFEGGARLVWWTLLTLAITLGVFAVIRPERFGSDGMTNGMGELSLQFVFGRATEAGFLPPRSHSRALRAIVRETWGSGVVFLVFSSAAALALFLVLPAATSLADIFG